MCLVCYHDFKYYDAVAKEPKKNPECDLSANSESGKKMEVFSYEQKNSKNSGTYASNQSNHNGTYSVDGDRLRISGILVEDKTFTFQLKGDKLYLDASNGLEYEFEKAD